jgi:hypothetical protein
MMMKIFTHIILRRSDKKIREFIPQTINEKEEEKIV